MDRPTVLSLFPESDLLATHADVSTRPTPLHCYCTLQAEAVIHHVHCGNLRKCVQVGRHFRQPARFHPPGVVSQSQEVSTAFSIPPASCLLTGSRVTYSERIPVGRLAPSTRLRGFRERELEGRRHTQLATRLSIQHSRSDSQSQSSPYSVEVMVQFVASAGISSNATFSRNLYIRVPSKG